MLRKAIHATLIVILMMGAVSAQPNNQGLPGYSNAERTDAKKKNDRELDRAYQSTVKGTSDAQKRTLIRGDQEQTIMANAAQLGEGQKSESAGSQARGGGRLGQMI